MKITKGQLKRIIKEEMERYGFAKHHDFGIDTIPKAKNDKGFKDIIGHT